MCKRFQVSPSRFLFFEFREISSTLRILGMSAGVSKTLVLKPPRIVTIGGSGVSIGGGDGFLGHLVSANG